MMKFQIYRARRGLFLRTQWRWRLIATNGHIVATSGESYNNRLDMLRTMESIRKHVPNAKIEEIE